MNTLKALSSVALCLLLSGCVELSGNADSSPANINTIFPSPSITIPIEETKTPSSVRAFLGWDDNSKRLKEREDYLNELYDDAYDKLSIANAGSDVDDIIKSIRLIEDEFEDSIYKYLDLIRAETNKSKRERMLKQCEEDSDMFFHSLRAIYYIQRTELDVSHDTKLEDAIFFLDVMHELVLKYNIQY